MLLSRRDRELYDAIYKSLRDENPVVHASLQGTSGEKIEEIITSIQSDHPELAFFHWSIEYGNGEIRFTTPVVSIYRSPFYHSRLEKIIKGANERKTEYDKEIFIHDYIVQNISFDHDEIKDNRSVRENHTVEGPLKNGKAVCEGIARFTQLLLLEAGLKAIYVEGTSRSFATDEPGGHAWVIVCIEGSYYHLDVSHDICMTEDKSRVKYNYFNLTDEEILYDHTLDNPSKLRNLVCNCKKFNYFYQFNRFFLQPLEIYQAILRFLRNYANHPHENTFLFRASLNISEEEVTEFVQKAMRTFYDETGMGVGYSSSESELQNVYSFTFTFES